MSSNFNRSFITYFIRSNSCLVITYTPFIYKLMAILYSICLKIGPQLIDQNIYISRILRVQVITLARYSFCLGAYVLPLPAPTNQFLYLLKHSSMMYHNVLHPKDTYLAFHYNIQFH